LPTDVQRRFTPAFNRPEFINTAKGFRQVSRLGHALVNEVVIGIRDKDRFNASEPKDDAQFLPYVTNPSLPFLIEALFGSAGVKAPTLSPRSDLVAVFLTGVEDLNKESGVGEILRLNTSIDAKAASAQNDLGVIGGDTAGYPNGRRPGDDVVDISLRAAMGVLLPVAQAPSGQLGFTDGCTQNATTFLERFPYLNTPFPGSPDSLSTNAASVGASEKAAASNRPRPAGDSY
jgi:hypothetical protein